MKIEEICKRIRELPSNSWTMPIYDPYSARLGKWDEHILYESHSDVGTFSLEKISGYQKIGFSKNHYSFEKYTLYFKSKTGEKAKESFKDDISGNNDPGFMQIKELYDYLRTNRAINSHIDMEEKRKKEKNRRREQEKRNEQEQGIASRLSKFFK